MKKILVVDDSRSMRNMVKTTLEADNYVVTEAENGKNACQLAMQFSFDLIISDVNMPEMDGISFVTTLRQSEQYKDTPILMLTTESAIAIKEAAKQAGATGWIVKPFSPEKLLSAINRMLR